MLADSELVEQINFVACLAIVEKPAAEEAPTSSLPAEVARSSWVPESIQVYPRRNGVLRNLSK